MHTPDHADRQTAFPVQHLRHARACSDDRLKVLASEPLLVHAELYGLDRIRGIHRIVPRLVGIDQRSEHVKAVAFRRVSICNQPGLRGAHKEMSINGALLVVRSPRHGRYFRPIMKLSGGETPLSTA